MLSMLEDFSNDAGVETCLACDSGQLGGMHTCFAMTSLLCWVACGTASLCVLPFLQKSKVHLQASISTEGNLG